GNEHHSQRAGIGTNAPDARQFDKSNILRNIRDSLARRYGNRATWTTDTCSSCRCSFGGLHACRVLLGTDGFGFTEPERLGDEGFHDPMLGDGADDVAAHEDLALAVAARDADVGLPGLAGA